MKNTENQELSPVDQIVKQVSNIYNDALEKRAVHNVDTENYSNLNALAIQATEFDASFRSLKKDDYPKEEREVYLRWFKANLATIENKAIPEQISLLKTMNSLISKGVS